MSLDQIYQQRWEFRKRHDEIDSSSDDSRPNSSDEAARNRDKLVSNLIFPENCGERDNLRYQQKSQLVSNMRRSQEKSRLGGNMNVNFSLLEAPVKHTVSIKRNNAVRHKLKRGSVKENKLLKKKRAIQETMLDDFKIFTESLIAEIRDARENIFAQMREELTKLAAVGSTFRPRRKQGSIVQKTHGRPPQIRMKSSRKNENCNSLIAERCSKRNIAMDSKDNYKGIEEQENVTKNRKEKGERSIPSVQKPIDLANETDHIVSVPSSYLTLPGVLPNPHVAHQRMGLYSKNHILPGIAINSSASNLDRENSVIGHNGYLLNIQPEEQLGSIVPFSSKDSSLFEKYSSQISAMGSGFPVPLLQGINNNFNIPNQIVLEEPSRGDNRMGLRTHGEASKFSQGSHALAERFISNCLSSHLCCKTDGAVLPFKPEDLNTGNSH